MSVLNFVLSVPDAVATEVLADFCAYHGYEPTIMGEDGKEVSNPQTKAQFAKAKVAEFLKNSVKSYRANRSAEVARLAKLAEVEAIEIV